VDPVRDTPEVLAEFARQQGRLEGRWFFATGSTKEIEALTTEGFHLGEAGALLHSTRLALVDSAGHLRGFYESSDEIAMAHLLRDMALLTKVSR
jgi:protein SCO1/2